MAKINGLEVQNFNIVPVAQKKLEEKGFNFEVDNKLIKMRNNKGRIILEILQRKEKLMLIMNNQSALCDFVSIVDVDEEQGCIQIAYRGQKKNGPMIKALRKID